MTMMILIISLLAAVSARELAHEVSTLEAPDSKPIVRRGSSAARVSATGAIEAFLDLSRDVSANSTDASDDEANVATDEPTTTTVAPVDVLDASKIIQMEDDMAECLMTAPLYECFEQQGSFGVRRLLNEDYEDMMTMGLARPDWMKTSNVQSARLFNLTLPGSRHSGSYDFTLGKNITGTGLAFGYQFQSLGVDQQLVMGIRAFDLQVTYNILAQELYIATQVLTVPLAEVLGQMVAFLQLYTTEVLLLNVHLAPASPGLDEAGRQVIAADDNSSTRVPGQTIHELMDKTFARRLATFTNLARMPLGESMENPRIKNLVSADARVLYFWNGQQVLCINLAACQRTPGWVKAWNGLAFGAPLPLGMRTNSSGGGSGSAMEPGCVARLGSNGSAVPETAADAAKLAILDLPSAVSGSTPTCFPADAQLPAVHQPTLLYWLDVAATLSADQVAAQQAILGNSTSFATSGDNFTVSTMAERVNYLALTWLLKQGTGNVFSQPSVIALDFVSHMVVHRLVEANIGAADCGWSVRCLPTGSCWAQSRLDDSDPSGQTCLPDSTVGSEIESSNMPPSRFRQLFTWFIMMGGFPFFGIFVLCMWCGAFSAGNDKEKKAASPDKDKVQVSQPLQQISEDPTATPASEHQSYAARYHHGLAPALQTRAADPLTLEEITAKAQAASKEAPAPAPAAAPAEAPAPAPAAAPAEAAPAAEPKAKARTSLPRPRASQAQSEEF